MSHLYLAAKPLWPGLREETQDWGWRGIALWQTESKSSKALVYRLQNNHLELAKIIWNQRGLQAIRVVNLDRLSFVIKRRSYGNWPCGPALS